MKDNETKQRFIELRATGKSFDNIAKELNVSKPTLIKWQGELAEQINELNFINFDSLVKQYQMTKQARIERFGKMLQNVSKEIEQRDFSKISTEKLYELQFKLIEKLQGEFQEISHKFGDITKRNFDAIMGYVLRID